MAEVHVKLTELEPVKAALAELTARAERAEAAIQRVDSYVRLLESELDDDQGDDDYSHGRFAAQRQIVADLQERGFGLDAQRPEERSDEINRGIGCWPPVGEAPERSDEGPKKTDAEWWMQIALNTANRYGDLLGTILSKFTEKGHPGEPCVRTGWIPERLVAEWRDRAAGGQLDAPAPTRSGEERPVIPVVLNPEAVGDPTQTPRVYIGPLQERL